MPCLDSHCSFLHNGNMYIYGGYQAEYATYNDEIYVYEISTRRLDCLQQIGRRPLGRCSFSLSLIKNTFYVFGGCHETNLNDLWSFNLATCNWTEVFSTNTLWPEVLCWLYVASAWPFLLRLPKLFVPVRGYSDYHQIEKRYLRLRFSKAIVE